MTDPNEAPCAACGPAALLGRLVRLASALDEDSLLRLVGLAAVLKVQRQREAPLSWPGEGCGEERRP